MSVTEPDGGEPAPRKVCVVMASESDADFMKPCFENLDKLEVPFDVHIRSAHRSPHHTANLAEGAAAKYALVIAAAGGAAALAGAIAAITPLPVIGVPLPSSPLQGLDALLSTAQMPPGVPVATMSIGKWGAANAAIFAAEILGVSDPEVRRRIVDWKKKQERRAVGMDERIPPPVPPKRRASEIASEGPPSEP